MARNGPFIPVVASSRDGPERHRHFVVDASMVSRRAERSPGKWAVPEDQVVEAKSAQASDHVNDLGRGANERAAWRQVARCAMTCQPAPRPLARHPEGGAHLRDLTVTLGPTTGRSCSAGHLFTAEVTVGPQAGEIARGAGGSPQKGPLGASPPCVRFGRR
jgi:hypothetical protein